MSMEFRNYFCMTQSAYLIDMTDDFIPLINHLIGGLSSTKHPEQDIGRAHIPVLNNL